MKHKLRIALVLVLSVQSLALYAADNKWSLDESIYASGKIYVVVGVAAIILIGIFLYLFKLDSRVRKMEEQINAKKA